MHAGELRSEQPETVKFYARVVYVWKGQDILNIQSSVRLPSAGTILYAIVVQWKGNGLLSRTMRVRVPPIAPIYAPVAQLVEH